jgi:hypothetical protein
VAINELGMELKEYKLIEEGDYDAVIFGVINLGLQKVEYKDEVKSPATFIRLILEIPSIVNEKGEPATIQKKVKLTASVDKGNYAKLLLALGYKVDKSSIGKYLSIDGLKGLIGKSVVAKIAHFNTSDGKRNMVQELVKLDPRLPQPVGTKKQFLFNPFSPDLDIFKNDVTSYGQDEIMKALNAANFPKELHEAYAASLEAREAKKAGRDTGNSRTSGAIATDTSAIE